MQTSNGDQYQGNPIPLLDKNLDFCLGPQKFMRFVRKDALDLKTSVPMGHNGFVQGFLWFSIPTLDRAHLVDPSSVIHLHAKSVAGQDVRIESGIRDLVAKLRSTSFFPGIENPRSIDGPCKENAPY